jgi:signal transduction histidine kinase
MRLSKAFAKQPRIWIGAEMALLLVGIGALDLMSGYKFQLLPFYAVPIFVVGWFCGQKTGAIAAVLSGIIWSGANWFNGDPDLRQTWIAFWETGRHFGFFLLVTWAASALRTRSDIAAARIALLEHSQRLEHEIVNISEAEQRRIGQDLHDGLCQYLAALSCSARSLQDDLEKLHLRSEAAAARELATHLQGAVVQARDLARGLVLAQVGQVGIVIALESLAQAVGRSHEMTCTFHFRGAVTDCDEHTATHLYRIAQEAINNATKHAKASRIAIFLEATADLMTLRILDDGVGLPGFTATGTGMSIMRYRARLCGGELTSEQPKGGGTLVSCTIRKHGQTNEVAAA